MKHIHYSSKFKKDFKKYRLFPDKVTALDKVLRLLVTEQPLPKEYRAHILKGNYKGCWECHIEDDYLLIWIDDVMIELLRHGSHTELFSKNRK